MSQRILCVCLGNICRSPAAEVALREKLPGFEIDSAGTAGWHVGKPPYGPMQEAASTQNMDLSDLCARQISSDDFNTFDLILVMDQQNKSDVEALRPPGSATQVALFASEDVPDPYYTRDFDEALDIIQAAAETWADQLQVASADAAKRL